MDKKWIFFIVVPIILISFQSQGQFNQYLPNKVPEIDKVENDPELKELDLGRAPSSNSKKIPEIDKTQEYQDLASDSPHVLQKKNKRLGHNTEVKSRVLETGVRPLGTYDESDKYLEFDKETILQGVEKKGDTTFSMSYLKDKADLENNSTTNSSTPPHQLFEESAGGKKVGFFFFSVLKKFLRRDFFDISFGSTVGAAFYEGKQKDMDGETQISKITLWSVPWDFFVTNLDFKFFDQALKVSLFGAPSVMALLQSRSDKTDGQKGKRRRQLGFGGAIGVSVKYSLYHITRGSSFDLLSSYGVSDLLLSAELRYHTYDNFQDDGITAKGISGGLGLAFEFL